MYSKRLTKFTTFCGEHVLARAVGSDTTLFHSGKPHTVAASHYFQREVMCTRPVSELLWLQQASCNENHDVLL
jgi:hypothetical protein